MKNAGQSLFRGFIRAILRHHFAICGLKEARHADKETKNQQNQ